MEEHDKHTNIMEAFVRVGCWRAGGACTADPRKACALAGVTTMTKASASTEINNKIVTNITKSSASTEMNKTTTVLKPQ